MADRSTGERGTRTGTRQKTHKETQRETQRKTSGSGGEKKGRTFSGNAGRGAAPWPAHGGKPEGRRFNSAAGFSAVRPSGPSRPVRPQGAVPKRNADGAPTPGRTAALSVLCDVREKGAFISAALDKYFSEHNLPQIEKRFCTNLTYSCEENRLKTAYVLDRFLQDREALSVRLQLILEMSVSQKLYMDKVPDSAIVDEAVKLTRSSGAEGMTGLVNAVLRKAFTSLDTDFIWPDREKDRAGYLSVMYSVPRWLCEKLSEEYGDDAEKICAYRGQHYITVRPNRIKYPTSEAFRMKVLDKKVWDCEKALFLDAWYIRGASDISRDADYASGGFSIEGVSSMLAAEALNCRSGMQVLDACAAPGGKTAYIAEGMKGTGRVYAWDVYEHRVELIRAMARRLGLDNVRPVVRDASVFREDMAQAMDAVLLDAPCTGLGVMDNKPDIKYKVSEEQVRELTALQEKLLETCSGYVRRGGTLVYSTCSLLKEENEEQVRLFLRKHPEFRLVSLPESFGPLRDRMTDSGLQILPWRDGIDGFFIAAMKRE